MDCKSDTFADDPGERRRNIQAIGTVVFLTIDLLLIIKISQGRRWARNTNYVIVVLSSVLGIPAMLAMSIFFEPVTFLLTLSSMVLQVIAVVLFSQRSSETYFT